MRNSAVNPQRAGKHILILSVVFLSLCIGWCGPVMGSESSESHGEAPQTKGWVATDTYRVINFAILAGALIFLLRKPVKQALSSRISTIKQQLDELEEKKQSAEKELAAYHEKLALLEGEGAKIVEEYVRQGRESKERILKEAEANAVKLEEKARKNIEDEFKQARQRLQAEIIERAMDHAERKITAKITPEDQNKLVEEYLEKVVAS